MNKTQGAELTIRELLQKKNVSNGDIQRADRHIYQAVVDSQKNAKIVEWVEIKDERPKEKVVLRHNLHLAASIIVIILLYFVVNETNK